MPLPENSPRGPVDADDPAPRDRPEENKSKKKSRPEGPAEAGGPASGGPASLLALSRRVLFDGRHALPGAEATALTAYRPSRTGR